MADLPSTVALPQPLIEPVARQADFERRPTAFPHPESTKRLTFNVSLGDWTHAMRLKLRHRVSVSELLRCLLRGMPLPPPITRRVRPSPIDADTALLVMQLRDLLERSLRMLEREVTRNGPAPAQSQEANVLLQRYVRELVPMLEALARMLLGGPGHE